MLLKNDPRKRMTSKQLFNHPLVSRKTIFSKKSNRTYFYDDTSLLGKGAFGKVYKAQDAETFEEVAIKRMNITKLVE